MDKKLVFCVVLRMKVHTQRQWILRFMGTKIYWDFTNRTVGQKVTSQCIKVYFGFFPVDPYKKSLALTALPVHYSAIFCHYNWITIISLDKLLYRLCTELRSLCYQPPCQNNLQHAIICNFITANVPRKRRKHMIIPKRNNFLINRNKLWYYG